MDRFRIKTPFCGDGDLRSVSITAGFVYLVGLVYSKLDYAAVYAQIVTRTPAFVRHCVLH